MTDRNPIPYCLAHLNQLIPPTKTELSGPRRHTWGPSRVGHGEAQCTHCLITNREALVIAPEFCLNG